ncbi:acetyltransferase (GNAT) family protein [Arcicella aurantiaca]|uniref:Acetyltransferase (GNAT) family protein n=1 Tax=Arcicella aurantiaca TaxID=591202 RepID=A0A316DYZ8_9BACT|nr:GNAT family N-acetyltransferase [Arcicella aurantiaca]PWK23344.1 acetyltransferase (GNAT) family protein [Arcicella aurantiaca]
MIFSLRKATENDLDLTYKIKKNALYEYLEMLWGWNEQAQDEFHREHYKKAHFQIIELQEKAIGYLETENRIDHIFLSNIMILKEFQEKGIGKIILEDLIKQHSEIRLEVLKVNKRAIQFYQNLGFEIKDENEDSYQMSNIIA